MLNDYDDIYLVPKEGVSPIQSRCEVDLCSTFHGLYPILSSPMKNISGVDLVVEMAHNNCLGILHRMDSDPQVRVHKIHEIAKHNVPFGVAIGVKEFYTIEMDIAMCAFENGAVLLCVDCANGYMAQLEEIGAKLVSRFGTEVALMCGNVVTADGAYHLSRAGYDFVRIGIGSGTVCTTRRVTGIGRNNLAALQDCSLEATYVVADGGINEPGKAVKAFAFGADMVMIGSALAYSFESEGDEIYGMASERLHRENNKLIKSIEGEELKIDPSQKKPLKDILDQYLWGIRSACSYLGARSYREIPQKAKIVPVQELTHGYEP